MHRRTRSLPRAQRCCTARDDLDSLKRGAAACDGVIHTAFIHDFTNFAANCAIDKAAIETLGATLEGSGRPLVVSSGMSTPPGRVGTEEESVASVLPRKSEETALSMVARGVRAKTREEAGALLGFISHILAMDIPASSALTQERLGWRPTGPGLIADLEKGRYFSA